MNDCFHSLAKYLNKISNYMLDWTRVGELLRSGQHHYSLSELIPRIFIGVFIIAPIVIHRTITWESSLQSLLCFVISHTIVISYLILKRYKMKSDCDEIIKSIKIKHCKCNYNNQKNRCQVCIKIDSIFSNVTTKSSAVWGYRKRKLTKLVGKLF